MRAVMRRVTGAAAAMAAAGALAAGMLAGAGPAGAAPVVLFAAVTAAGTGDCSQPADACTLSTALGDVAAGGTIELVTAGSTARYVGNWSVTTSGTSASAPVTLEPMPGLSSQPILDGDGPNAPPGETCSTTACDGAVLTVSAGEYVALSGITIADGNNNGLSTDTGGGLDNYGTVTITGCTFTGNNAVYGGAIDNDQSSGNGTVTVTASTFTGNTATSFGGAIDSGTGNPGPGGAVTVTASTFTGNSAGEGGAIDSGDTGSGAVTVTASTFTGNSAGHGGAIDSGEENGGGSVTVTASTFTGNTATDGGAIDSGDGNLDFPSSGTVTVTASTFTGNTATDGGTIDSGDHGGGGTVLAAGDLFDGSCAQPGGTWTDGGYNAGTDTSCFASSPPASDTSGSAVGSDLQAALTGNGGPTQTIAPTTGNPAIGLIPDPTTVTLGGSPVALCPATDQRGYASAASTKCDAGAVQTAGHTPLALKVSASPHSFNHAGQVLTFSYTVTNTGTGPLSGVSVTDLAVAAVSCPPGPLAAGASETCTGSYTVTRADLAAGKITEAATATGTAGGVSVASAPASVTVPEGWPPQVTGFSPPAAHAAEGVYLGASGSTWTLFVTHPGTGKVSFTGTVTLNAGRFRDVTGLDLERGDSVQVSGKTLTFRFTDYGDLDGVRFATTAADTKITFALDIAGHPATAGQLFLGGGRAHPSHGSPLTFTR